MRTIRRLAILAVAAGAAACSKSESTADSANGTVAQQKIDSTTLLGATPVAGAAQVTPTDAKSATRATEYKLTDDNFNRFVQASESLFVLRKRDPQARALLDEQVSDNGSGTRVTASDAGIKHLESNVAVNNAITASGMSVADYLIASIAIAQAARFIDDPKAAPPTPALADNARFLAARRAKLAELHSGGAISGTTKP